MHIKNSPPEGVKEAPNKNLGIYSYGRDQGLIYCIFLFEPGTIPLKGYEYNLKEEKIVREIEDLQIDRFARFAPKMTEMVAGDTEKLGKLAKEAEKKHHDTGGDFETILKNIQLKHIRDSVDEALG